MNIKKWGTQVFLNHSLSPSSGWVKFNIRPERREGAFGIESEAQLADCSKKIVLEFEPRTLYPSYRSGMYDVKSILESKKSIRHRRAKVAKFRKAVVEYCDRMNEALNEMERAIDAIPPAVKYDSRKEDAVA